MWILIIFICLSVLPAAIFFSFLIEAVPFYYNVKKSRGESIPFTWRKGWIFAGSICILMFFILGLTLTIKLYNDREVTKDKYEQVQEPLYRKL